MNNYISNTLKLLDFCHCSGYGKLHTNNPSKVKRTPYLSITWTDILEMLLNPQQVDKDNGNPQWVIFSDQTGEYGRNAEYLRANAHYSAIWADIDERGYPKSKLEAFIDGLNCIGFIYSTSSATTEGAKWRIILPLAVPVGGAQFELMQRVLNDRLQAAGITPDITTQNVMQLCYLPNRGKYYDYSIVHSDYLDDEFEPLHPSLFASEVEAIEQAETEHRAQLEAQREANRVKQSQRVISGELSPIAAYNEAFSIESELEINGYIKRGNRWLSPNSESGSAGVSVKGGRWLSSHSSDAALGIGRSGKSGCSGDAFDLFKFYNHSNDQSMALKAAGDMFKNEQGKTITQQNQRNHMETQSGKEVMAMFNNEPISLISYSSETFEMPELVRAEYDALPQNPLELQQKTQPQPQAPINNGTAGDLTSYSISNFILNGQAQAMKSKMLDDKFILGKLAILGQATVFYAKPNSGKTLLTMWLIIDAIKRGELNGSDVYYVNADDTFKGLQQKLELAEEHGFYMLAPGHNGFKADMLGGILNELICTEQARGKVLILDTLKKFTDLMAKDKSSNFAEMTRQFVSHGGSMIMLAHTNKHRGDDGKQVFAGTADIVDDSDCAYILDEVSQKNGTKVVEFENFKNRGDVEQKASYQYNSLSSVTYKEKLKSVTSLDSDEVERAKEYRDKQNQYEKDKPVIDDIIKIMEQNPDMLKTDLVKAVNEDAGHTKERIRKVLNIYDGDEAGQNHKWRSVKGENNAHTYKLNWWAMLPDKVSA